MRRGSRRTAWRGPGAKWPGSPGGLWESFPTHARREGTHSRGSSGCSCRARGPGGSGEAGPGAQCRQHDGVGLCGGTGRDAPWGEGLWGPLCCGSSDRGQRGVRRPGSPGPPREGPTCPRLYRPVGSLLHEHESAAAEVVQVVGEVEQRGVVEGAVGHLRAGREGAGRLPLLVGHSRPGGGTGFWAAETPRLGPRARFCPGLCAAHTPRPQLPAKAACADARRQARTTAVPGTAAVSPRPGSSHLPRRQAEQTRLQQALSLLLHTRGQGAAVTFTGGNTGHRCAI